MKKCITLTVVLSPLLVNQAVAMDGEASAPRRNSMPGSSSKSSARVIITNLDSPIPSPKGKFASLDDIDWDSTPPATPNSHFSAKQTSQKTVHFHDNRVIVQQTKPSSQYREPTWSEALSSPRTWMPVITGITAGVTQATAQLTIDWWTQDSELAGLTREIQILKGTNTKKILEGNQDAIEARNNMITQVKQNLQPLLDKVNAGQKLSNEEQTELQTNLSIFTKLIGDPSN